MVQYGEIAEALQTMSFNGELVFSVLLLCALTSFLLLKKLRESTSKERFPPGPFAWPYIGHLHLLANLPHQSVANLSKKYGPIVGLRLGQQKVVAVLSPELAKEVLVTLDNAFDRRPPLDFISTLLYGSANDVIFADRGPAWRKQRRFCVMSLFTAKRMQELEYLRHEEIGSLLLRLHQHASAGGGPIDIGRSIGQTSSHIITRLLLSKASLSLGHENLPELVKEVEHQASIPTLGDLIPALSFLDIPRKKQMRRVHDRFDKIISAAIAERDQSNIAHDDLLHALLSKASHDPSIPPEEAFTLQEVKGIILDLLAASIQTTTAILEWAMAELLRNPQCFQRLQQEIDTQLGAKKQIIDADISNLSYLKCVVKEVFRLHPGVPMLLPRTSSDDYKISDYTLPANTIMFVNVWAIHRDETLWPHANKFMPERFESKDIDIKGQNFELLPFGSGRRICLGMPMALSIVNLTLANLVKNFDWGLPHGEIHNCINMTEQNGITNTKATPLMVIPKPRI